MSEESILQWLAEFAHQPYLVYPTIIGLLFASSFGLPIPEEVTILSAGLLTYMSMNPDLYPHNVVGGEALNPYVMACVCFGAVFISDALVFFLGKILGARVMKWRLLARVFQSETWTKVEDFAKKYGHWTCGVFRFTPGLRFPGHFWCGMMGIPFWKFTAIDGTAALVTVPTQVLLMAFYGETVLGYLKTFKVAILAAAAIGVMVYLVRKFIWSNRKTANDAAGLTTGEAKEVRGKSRDDSDLRAS